MDLEIRKEECCVCGMRKLKMDLISIDADKYQCDGPCEGQGGKQADE